MLESTAHLALWIFSHLFQPTKLQKGAEHDQVCTQVLSQADPLAGFALPLHQSYQHRHVAANGPVFISTELQLGFKNQSLQRSCHRRQHLHCQTMNLMA